MSKKQKEKKPRKPLQRRTHLRSYSRLKGGGPLRKRSKKLQKLYDEEYIPLLKAFLQEHPTCQICGIRPAQGIHHKAKSNSDRRTDTSKWMAACHLCNGAVEDMGKAAYELGYKEYVNRAEGSEMQHQCPECGSTDLVVRLQALDPPIPLFWCKNCKKEVKPEETSSDD